MTLILYLVITAAALAAASIIQKTQGSASFAVSSAIRQPVCMGPYARHSFVPWKKAAGSMPCPEETRAAQLRKFSFGLLFLILVIPAVLRQACGNDYMRYVEFFHLAYVDAYVPTEPGFNIFVRLIYGLCGYENYILVFALFSIMTIGLFLLAIWQQAQSFAASFFLFMMMGFYFQTYNTVRYYFALALALFALRFFMERQYLPFVLLILLAAAFHKSVLCVLVLYPLCIFPWKRWQALVVGLFGVLLNVFRTQVMALVVRLYPSYEDTDILAAGGHISWPNIARCAAVLLLYLVCQYLSGDGERRTLTWIGKKSPAKQENRKSPTQMGLRTSPVLTEEKSPVQMETETSIAQTEKMSFVQAGQSSAAKSGKVSPEESEQGGASMLQRRQRFYRNAAMFSLFIYVFCCFIPEISRISYYLVITQIFFVPELILQIPAKTQKNKKARRFLAICVAAAGVVIFAGFLYRAYGSTVRILPYKTFLFSDLPETPSRSIE